MKRAIYSLIMSLLLAGIVACSASATILMDDVLNNSTLGMASTITYTAGGSDQAGLFTGGSEYIKYDKSLFASQGTISLQVKVQGYSGKTIIDTGDGFMLRPTSANTLQFLMYDSSISNYHSIAGKTILDPTKWYNVAISYGSEGMKLYVNGKAEGTFSNGDTAQSRTSKNVFVGHYTGGSTNSFTGAIDWVRTSDVQNDTSLLIAPAEVPEPSSLVVIISGLVSAATLVRRRRS